MRLGLIEATHTEVIDFTRVLYPRRMRLGLIEAIQSLPEAMTAAERYPRRMRLGLIEAAARCHRYAPGPAYPRRMRLGLIEASRVCVGFCMIINVSEAHAPRPH